MLHPRRSLGGREILETACACAYPSDPRIGWEDSGITDSTIGNLDVLRAEWRAAGQPFWQLFRLFRCPSVLPRCLLPLQPPRQRPEVIARPATDMRRASTPPVLLRVARYKSAGLQNNNAVLSLRGPVYDVGMREHHRNITLHDVRIDGAHAPQPTGPVFGSGLRVGVGACCRSTARSPRDPATTRCWTCSLI